MSLLDRVQAEVERLHAEIEAWFAGTTDDFAPIDDSLSDDFSFIHPNGGTVDRESLVGEIRAAHSTRTLPIRIENVRARSVGDGVVLASYEEWHDHDSHSTARLSTAIFSDGGGRLVWRHVQETWMVPPPHRQP